MGDFDIKWLFFFPVIVAISMSLMNPSTLWFALGNTSQNIAEVPADCDSYKSQIDQQQAKIEQLDKDISDCKNQNPSGFTIWDFLLGFIMGAGIVIFWAYWNEKERKAEEEWKNICKLSKAKGKRRMK